MNIYHADIACPTCTRPIDLGKGLTGVALKPPQRGDVTVCANCLELLMFTGPSSVGVLGAESLEQLAPRMRNALTSARELLASHTQPVGGGN